MQKEEDPRQYQFWLQYHGIFCNLFLHLVPFAERGLAERGLAELPEHTVGSFKLVLAQALDFFESLVDITSEKLLLFPVSRISNCAA